MLKILDPGEAACTMRAELQRFALGLAAGHVALRLPPPPGPGVARGDGHFHLGAELFLQVGGWTRFRFPDGEVALEAGEALLMPPRLLHAEAVGASEHGTPFGNLVIYAEGGAMSCHLAHEREPGKPGILHLESRRHAHVTPAARVHDWLHDAARLGQPDAFGGEPQSAAWAAAHARALVLAAITGVLRALGETEVDRSPEPAVISRLRVLIQNQLGDHRLSVKRLGEQCGYSADHLSHLFSQSCDEPLLAFIQRQRMARAAHLLAESEMAGKEIAWACGFATQSYFIRTFRAHFGATPKAWRATRRVA